MPKKIVKETPVKNQTGKKIKKAVDDALIAAVLSRVAEIGVRKAAEEAGVAWQTVNKWMKEKELTTPDDIKAAVEGVADVIAPVVEEKKAEPAAPTVEEKTAPAVEEEKTAPVELIIESTMGGQISADEIIKRVKEKRSDATKIYVKPEENKAYFTYGDSVGHVELW